MFLRRNLWKLVPCMYELFRDIRQLHVDLIQELDLHSKLNKKKSFVVTDSIHILVRLKNINVYLHQKLNAPYNEWHVEGCIELQ